MKKFTLHGFPFIMNPVDIVPENYAGLKPGDLVEKIGTPGRNGKTTSANRVDTWLPWIRYAGTIILVLDGVPESKYLAFQLPPAGLKKKDGTDVTDPVFALYAIVDDSSIVRQNLDTQTIYNFKAKFLLHE